MTNIEKIKTFSIEELSGFLDSIGFDNTPWMNWFENKYCNNCDCVKCFHEAIGAEVEYSYCEFYKVCKFFPDRLSDDINGKIICAMWLKENNYGEML